MQRGPFTTLARPCIAACLFSFAPSLQAGIKAFSSLEIDTCYTILEMLYSEGVGQFRGAIERGGKLMAGVSCQAA
jgi:hypothetical protein